MHAPPWTPADEAELVELVLEGASPAEAASALGRTVESVKWRALRLKARGRLANGFPVGRPPDLGKRSRLIVLFGAGCTLSQAARVTGVSGNSVRTMARHLARLGLLIRTGNATRNVRYRPATERELRKAR